MSVNFYVRAPPLLNRQGIERFLKLTVCFVCRENLYTPDNEEGVV